MEQARNPATKLATALSKLQGHMVDLGHTLSKNLTPALIWLENAGSKVIGWAVKALPIMVKLTRQGFHRLYLVGRDCVQVILDIANGGFVAWVLKATGAVGSFVGKGLQMFIQGWHDLMAAIQPVIVGLQTVVGLIPQVQLPSLPGAGPTVTATGGTAAQRRAATKQLQKKAGFLGVKTHAATGGGVVIHQHTGDFVVQVGGKEWGRITRREMQKAMMAGA